MAINPLVKQLATKVRNAIYGSEVRESIAKSMEVTNELTEDTKTRQDNVESQWQAVVDETTGKDIISAPEILASRVGEDGTPHANLKDRLDDEQQKTNAQLAQTKLRANWITPFEFGAVGDGLTDDTQAFKDAMAHCRSKKVDLFVPPSFKYLITSPLPMPNQYNVFGGGFGSNIALDLTDGQFCFDGTGEWLYRFGIKGLLFTLASGANKNVGAIKLNMAQRGNSIEHIWTEGLRKTIRATEKIWGILKINNIYSYNIGTGNDPLVDKNEGIVAEGNTIMMSDIEVIGSYYKGIVYGGIVFNLKGFNVAGSGTAKMIKGIEVVNAQNGTIQDGWIEQLDDVYWSNGKGHAIYIKNSKEVGITNVNVASGSIFSDNSDITIENISYAQNEGGLKLVNDGHATSDLRSIGKMGHRADTDFSNGEVKITNAVKSMIGLLNNSILMEGLSVPQVVTNGSLVTLSQDKTDYLSGESSTLVSITANNQGVKVEAPAIPGKIYTIKFKVRKKNPTQEIYIKTTSQGTIDFDYPHTLTRSVDEWHTLSIVLKATSNVIGASCLGRLAGDAFLLDSVNIYKGFSQTDPSLDTKKTLMKENSLYSYRAPTTGTWEKTDLILNNMNTTQAESGWICSVGGTPGTWKAISLV